MLQITIMSITLIFLVHYLINFFKSTLTVPKIKDLVNEPSKKYENIYKIISKKNIDENHDRDIGNTTFIGDLDTTYINNSNNSININGNKSNDSSDYIPKPDVETMKNELKNFFKTQMGNVNTVSNENINEYAAYDNGFMSSSLDSLPVSL